MTTTYYVDSRKNRPDVQRKVKNLGWLLRQRSAKNRIIDTVEIVQWFTGTGIRYTLTVTGTLFCLDGGWSKDGSWFYMTEIADPRVMIAWITRYMVKQCGLHAAEAAQGNTLIAWRAYHADGHA